MRNYREVKNKSIAPIFLIIVTGAVYSSLSSAQIITDGTVGAQVTLNGIDVDIVETCLLYTSPSPRDGLLSRMPSSA